jgi:PAS domain S-box-containing protein
MRRRDARLWPVFVGALSLAVTAWLWRHERQTQEQHLRDTFEFGLRQSVTRIEQRLAGYEQMLRGVRGLFEAAAPVTRAGFTTYVDTLLTGADYAGLRNISYAPWLGADVLPAHVAAQRAAGLVNYALNPPGERTHVAPITYAAPDLARSAHALGYDPYTDPARRKAMDSARDSGGAAMTDRVPLFRSPGEHGEPGFLMIMPLFAGLPADAGVAQRRARLSGWVLAAFRIDDLMSSLYGESTPGLDVRVFDGVETSAATQMYPSTAATVELAASRLEAQEYIGFAGHTWTVAVSSRPEFERIYGNDSARIIAVAGIGLSFALAALTWLLATRQQRAHEAAHSMTRQLREGAQRYRRIVETADEGIWMVDGQGRTSFVNPKLERMLGWDAQALDGRDWATFMADPAAGRALLDPGAPARPHELCFVRRDGSALWATLSTSHIVDAGGRADGVLAMVTDITDRRRAEAQRLVLENQLQQSQKMEAIGTLAGGIAHDFNNVLASILGNVALLQQAGGGPASELQSQARLQQIGRAAGHARGLVQQIVAFSRQQPQELSVQPLRKLIEDSVNLLRAAVPTIVELQLSLCAEPLHVDADPTQFQQVLLNLCTNAWHAFQGHAGRIEVGLGAVVLDEAAARVAGLPQAGRFARVWVSDNGVGMDEATRLRAFEPFFTTKPVGQGTGLGLSVVHGIVASHRGVIELSSAPGRGSRFDILLPLVPAGAPSAPLVPDLPAAMAGHGEDVLYVDDDIVMVAMVEGLLHSLGYRVTAVADPVAACQRLRDPALPCDVLVTDYNMPTLSGLDLAREAAAHHPHLPVLLTSGFVTDTLRAAAAAAGVRHVLQKEYTLERLGPLLYQMLGEEAAVAQGGNRKPPHR